MSKGLMVAGIVLLLGVIGVLVYMSQSKPAEAPTAQAPETSPSPRTKEAIGVFSSIKPGDEKGSDRSTKDSSEQSDGVLKGETSNSGAEGDNRIKGMPFLTGDRNTPNQDANATASGDAKSAVPEKQADNRANKSAVFATTENTQPEKTSKTAPPPHKKKHRKNEETFFEIAPGSGTHKRDALDYVAP